MPTFKKRNPKASTRGADPRKADLAAIFEKCGLKLPDDILARFWEFHQLLRARNEELDLTRLHGFDNMVLKHYVDSAVVAGLTTLPSPLLDLGTGAGFPGIPLKLVRPELEIILAEGRGRKLAFLEEAIDKLGLKGIDVYPHKVSSKFDRPIKGIITRDLESISRTLDRAVNFLPQGGRVIFMKGPAADTEIEEAIKLFDRDFGLEENNAYQIGDTGLKRRLVVFQRTTPVEAPRGSVPSIRCTEIASTQNPQYKLWQKILETRGIKKHHLAIMSGRKNVKEMLTDFPQACQALLGIREEDLAVEAPDHVIRYRLRPELFKTLDLFGTGPPLLITATPDLPRWSDDNWPSGCTLFIPFQDPGNVGAVIRAAAAFGVTNVVLLDEAAHPFHPKSLRTSGPAVFRTALKTGPSIATLHSDKAPLLSLGTTGRNIDGYEFPGAFGLVPGIEGPGLPAHLKGEQMMTIPMAPGIESLNAAVATGIVLYEWQRRVRK